MTINDRFMLPKRVRTMDQMADLLAAEQAELEQTQRTITALENQLTISTSTHLLPRHERLFALPVNSTESLEARRSRVLAKLNTHSVATVQAVKELVKIVIGVDSEVVEHFPIYTFEIILRNVDQIPDLMVLCATLDEMKPAHLLYRYIVALNPLTVPLYLGVQVSSYTEQILNSVDSTILVRDRAFDLTGFLGSSISSYKGESFL